MFVDEKGSARARPKAILGCLNSGEYQSAQYKRHRLGRQGKVWIQERLTPILDLNESRQVVN